MYAYTNVNVCMYVCLEYHENVCASSAAPCVKHRYKCTDRQTHGSNTNTHVQIDRHTHAYTNARVYPNVSRYIRRPSGKYAWTHL